MYDGDQEFATVECTAMLDVELCVSTRAEEEMFLPFDCNYLLATTSRIEKVM